MYITKKSTNVGVYLLSGGHSLYLGLLVKIEEDFVTYVHAYRMLVISICDGIQDDQCCARETLKSWVSWGV